MIEYLLGSIPWLRKRASILLSSFRSQNISPIIQTQVNEQIKELVTIISEIDELLSDPTLNDPDYTIEYLSQFRDWVRVLSEIEGVFLPLVERWQADEEYIQLLCNRICSECNFPKSIQPITALYSVDYFYVILNGLDVIYLPRLEGQFFLHIPDLYHEIAHILLAEKEWILWENFPERIREYFDKQHAKGLLLHSPLAKQGIYTLLSDSWINRWIIEFTCDVVATYLCGSAYGWSHLHLCASQEPPISLFHPNVGEDDTHPGNYARLKIIQYTLEDLGEISEVSKMQTQWELLANSLSEVQPLNHHVAYPETLLRELQTQIKKGLKTLGMRLFENSDKDNDHLVVTHLNKAWKIFWADPVAYSDWESKSLLTSEYLKN